VLIISTLTACDFYTGISLVSNPSKEFIISDTNMIAAVSLASYILQGMVSQFSLFIVVVYKHATSFLLEMSNLRIQVIKHNQCHFEDFLIELDCPHTHLSKQI